MPLAFHEKNGLVYLTAPILQAVPHGFTTRRGGVSPAPWDSLNLGPGRGDDPANVQENYCRLCAALGVEREGVVLSQQTHTTNLRRVTAEDAGKGLLRPRDYREIDGLYTDVPGLALTVFSADCGVILLWDPVRPAVAAVHAGWRGCAGGILEKAVQAMAKSYGSRPADLLAAIGPGIGQCCFETDGDVPEAMQSALGTDAEPHWKRVGLKWQVDLEGLNRQWLLRAGLRLENIASAGLCTACHPELFWSHRKMGDARGVQAAVIALPKGGRG